MILFLLLQRLVVFQGWLHCGSCLWFANIPFKTRCDISFQLFQIARFHGLPQGKIGAPAPWPAIWPRRTLGINGTLEQLNQW